MKEEIKKLVTEYIKAKEEEEQAKKRKEDLAEALKLEVGNEEASMEVNGYVLMLKKRQSISFDAALLPYLKAKGLQTYVRETLDDAGLKKAIKGSELFAKQIKTFTRVKNTQFITVKKAKV